MAGVIKPQLIEGSEDQGKKKLQSASIREIISQEIATMDNNPDLSPEEKLISEKTLKQLEITYGTDSLDTRINTHTHLLGLREEITKSIERYKQEKTLNRTDIQDLSSTFAGTLHRIEIENKIKKISPPDLSEEIETIGDLRNLSVETLIKLEDSHEGILLYAFTDIASPDTKIDLENFYWEPTQGMKLRVDFRGNSEAEVKIGAADLLPPSVRCITVYERGDKTLARTSSDRMGLKGRNQEGNGFFDNEGYIPVFSGDIVIIGGDKADKKGIDKEFENKYRKTVEVRNLKTGVMNKISVFDYESYEKDFGAKSKEYISNLRSKGLKVKKEYSEEELVSLETRINASGIRQSVINTAMEFLKNKTPGKHCWDWVDKVYKKAGAVHQNVYMHSNYKRNLIKKDPEFDRNPKNPPILNSIQPGDWGFEYNRNSSDRRGAHSFLFLRWIDKQNLIAEGASCPHSGSSGQIHRINFNKTPLVFLMKPIV